MKKLFGLMLAALLYTSSSNADVGLRHITCYSDWDTTVVYSGAYYVTVENPSEPTRARKINGIVGGKCILGNEVELPACVSMTADVFLVPPCSL